MPCYPRSRLGLSAPWFINRAGSLEVWPTRRNSSRIESGFTLPPLSRGEQKATSYRRHIAAASASRVLLRTRTHPWPRARARRWPPRTRGEPANPPFARARWRAGSRRHLHHQIDRDARGRGRFQLAIARARRRGGGGNLGREGSSLSVTSTREGVWGEAVHGSGDPSIDRDHARHRAPE